MLHKLVFDTTDTNTMAETHSVGAYLRAGADGALIDHQTIAATEWLQVVSALADGAGNLLTSTAGALDVNIKSPITIDTQLEGVYDVSLNPNPDNVGMISHSRAATPGDAQQVERSTAAAASSDAVVAANVHALDTNSFGMLYNGTTWDRWHGTGGSANVSVTSAVDAALANTAIASGTTTLTTAGTAQAAVASPLTARKYLWVMNNDNRVMYIGPVGVTSAGFPIPPGSMMELRAGPSVLVDLVGTKASQDARYMELS